jgi:hypothetical protein
MKILIIIFFLVPFSANSASLADTFAEQKAKSSKIKDPLKAELTYELMHLKKKLIVESLSAPQYNLFDDYGNVFITDKYIVRFGKSRAKSFLGRVYYCGATNDNFQKSNPVIIGIKKGSIYTNIPKAENSYEPHLEFEVDLRNPDHCYRKYGKTVKRCSFSKYDPKQAKALLISNEQRIKRAFDHSLNPCKEFYNYSEFDKLKFNP